VTKKKDPPDPITPRWARNAALAKYLNISGMCLWRWQRDAGIGFPQPTVIGTTSYTDLNVVDQWMRDRVATTLPKGRGKRVA
jgi:hypothetical protein